MGNSPARAVTDLLNPFTVFTALYAAAALSLSGLPGALLYLVAELLAAASVAGCVLLLRHRGLAGNFWLSGRAERPLPAAFLLAAFAALLTVLVVLDAPGELLRLTLSMGLASAAVALLTLRWKVSAHCTVAGHAAAAGLLVFGAWGLPFAALLPVVIWARLALGAHTPAQALAGAGTGAGAALMLMI
ncbi:hypothetical protein RxyAA322_20030 [Rubrobacter xylanophilus]|uniref:Phosphoesterase, PA-phosphatase related n=1 Tax=Rubrobacter xylanophilus TaxID=49319 RepID=A0A510HJG5_9ACTN|nr:hypothetical protein [Rubrobacter xylanophilus]BBL80149.1 hypothetical protein RxyAA322_20030 [Rubrobacter xylanophilus]